MHETTCSSQCRACLQRRDQPRGGPVVALCPGGCDLHDTELEKGFKVVGQHFCFNKPLLDIVPPTAAWAKRIVPMWAHFAAVHGFSGIHWDTLGAGGDLDAFLRAAAPILRERGLKQTCNFVNGAAWTDSLLTGNVVAFPFWEVWDVPKIEDVFFQGLEKWKTGVFACYPGMDEKHDGEVQNKHEIGVFPLDLIIKRWVKARKHGASYLAIGDGLRHLQTMFYPDAMGILDSDIRKMQKAIFADESVTVREHWVRTPE